MNQRFGRYSIKGELFERCLLRFLSKQGLCIGRGAFPVESCQNKLAGGLTVRLPSAKEGLACREATTGPKLMIFAIQAGNVNGPILALIGAEGVAPLGKRGQAQS